MQDVKSLSKAILNRLKEERKKCAVNIPQDKICKHFKEGANLTLRTLAKYEVAFGEEFYSVPLQKKPTERRRRKMPAEGWTSKPNDTHKINPVETRLFRVLSRLSRRITQIIQHQENMNIRTLAEKAGMDPTDLTRLIEGGVNPTLKTVASLEAVLGVPLMDVDGRSKSSICPD